MAIVRKRIEITQTLYKEYEIEYDDEDPSGGYADECKTIEEYLDYLEENNIDLYNDEWRELIVDDDYHNGNQEFDGGYISSITILDEDEPEDKLKLLVKNIANMDNL